jgi:hypothetical protein
MKRYGLFTKNSNEVINNIHAKSLEEAKNFFIIRKNLTIEQFDTIFEVKKIN